MLYRVFSLATVGMGCGICCLPLLGCCLCRQQATREFTRFL